MPLEVLTVIVKDKRSIITINGKFYCEISPNGLTLTQRQRRSFSAKVQEKQIIVPTRVKARYVHKNQIEVTLPDCQLDIWIQTSGIYQSRLARDIVKFLISGRNPPLVSDYSIWVNVSLVTPNNRLNSGADRFLLTSYFIDCF